MKSWIDFWNGGHSIYVNNRHKYAHAKKLLKDISSWIRHENYRVLDFGCGEALYAEELATKCKELVLVDSAENIMKTLRFRTSHKKSIIIKNVEACHKTKNETFDLIIVNSVFQYLSLSDTKLLLEMFKSKLKKNGELVIADIIPPNLSIMSDVLSLLKFAFANGFFFLALIGLFKTYFSDYTSLRKKVGLSFYSSSEFSSLLSEVGFNVRIMKENFGHNQCRLCFCATIA